MLRPTLEGADALKVRLERLPSAARSALAGKPAQGRNADPKSAVVKAARQALGVR